ncbi:hypothetical protein BJX96DRAFT_160702 [Aspergillus floccosus]
MSHPSTRESNAAPSRAMPGTAMITQSNTLCSSTSPKAELWLLALVVTLTQAYIQLEGRSKTPDLHERNPQDSSDGGRTVRALSTCNREMDCDEGTSQLLVASDRADATAVWPRRFSLMQVLSSHLVAEVTQLVPADRSQRSLGDRSQSMLESTKHKSLVPRALSTRRRFLGKAIMRRIITALCEHPDGARHQRADSDILEHLIRCTSGMILRNRKAERLFRWGLKSRAFLRSFEYMLNHAP